MWPAIRSFTAGALPLYGTCCSLIFDWWLTISHTRCDGVATPAEPNDSEPGLALSAATRSAKVLYGVLALTAMTLGRSATNPTGVKSSIGWNRRSLCAYGRNTLVRPAIRMV